MVDQTNEVQDLERVFSDASAEPIKISYAAIKYVTKNFAQVIGDGGFGVVYLGGLKSGMVAVKKLSTSSDISDKQFLDEVTCLKRVNNKNIVRFLGYCADTQGEVMEIEGTHRIVEVQHRLLCFEYVPNGSLHHYLKEKTYGHEWNTHYQIIKGICQGLHYLHQKRIYHLDLKPANVLLGIHMVPKITDFGVSRCIGEEQSTMVTKKFFGTLGYIAPEFIDKQQISYKTDIYSLGMMMINLLTRRTGSTTDNWLQTVDANCAQMEKCIEIAQSCVDRDPHKRPTTGEIIAKLNGTETTIRRDPQVIEEPKDDPGSSLYQVVQRFKALSILTVPERSSNNKQIEETVLVAISKIAAALGDKVMNEVKTKLSVKGSNLRVLPENLEDVKKDLDMMIIVIQGLDSADLRKKDVQSWIGELRKVTFRVEDVMDKYTYHIIELQEERSFTRFVKRTRYIKVFSAVADEVVEIKNEIKKVIELRRAWLPIDQTVRGNFIPVLIQDEDLVGIKDNQSKLIRWLDSEDSDCTVITVSGMDGVGKSTLVARVYDRMKNSFGLNAWITVSKPCEEYDLLRELLWKTGGSEKPRSLSIEKMDTFMLKQEIRSRLQDSGKCLFVFDDVWVKQAYESIQDVFKNVQSSRVIITTCKDDVASLAFSGHHLQVQPLDKVDALRLFCARAFRNTADQKCPLELKLVADQIVEQCQGLPLALISMGSLISTKQNTEHGWIQLFKQFQCELSKTDVVQAILKLSYDDLPGNLLRSCFLYCSLFPQDYTISRESLVRQWVAEGFAVAAEANTPEDVAELYLMELITRNMLEVVDYDELGRVSTCKMHDSFRDLALSTAKNEKFGLANHRGARLPIEKDVRRLSSYGWKDSDSSTTERFPHLRTLLSFEAITSTTQMLTSIFSGSCYLTVLELQDSAITEVPASIQYLFNLRYIGLRRTRVKSLPECIEKLTNLQTLDIKQTKIEKLPRGIVKIKKLRHLLADRVVDERQRSFQYFIGVQPPKDLSNMAELQTLETVEASDDLGDQLEKMEWLQSVWIGSINAMHSAKLFASLSKMPLLSSLLLSASDEEQTLSLQAFNPESRQLHRLIVRGRWAAEMLKCPIFQFQGHGKNLKYLALSWSGLTEDPLLLLAPHVPNLAYLSLNRASSAETLVVSDGSFPVLRTLVLKNFLNVNQITIGKGALQNIQGLYVVALPMLNKVPQNMECLATLKKLWMLYLHEDFKIQWGTNGMHMKMAHVPELRV